MPTTSRGPAMPTSAKTWNACSTKSPPPPSAANGVRPFKSSASSSASIPAIRAEALRLDLPTLQENAAAHERKEQEELFKDLIKRQRYEEAISVARAVIQKYPNSPTATELNKLLPRVDEFRRQAANASQAAIAGAFINPESQATQ